MKKMDCGGHVPDVQGVWLILMSCIAGTFSEKECKLFTAMRFCMDCFHDFHMKLLPQQDRQLAVEERELVKERYGQ
ncbi:MAG: hypothetical protein GY861_00930 [bacterium]|nr:hypothetical protein [bacterium]